MKPSHDKSLLATMFARSITGAMLRMLALSYHEVGDASGRAS